MAVTDVSTETNSGKQLLVIQKNAEKHKQILGEITKAEKDALDKRVKAETEAEKKLEEIRRSGTRAEIQAQKDVLAQRQKERLAAENTYLKAQKTNKEKADKIAAQYELASYRNLNVKQKFEYQQTLKQNLKDRQNSLKEQHKLLSIQLANETNSRKKQKLQQKIDEIKSEEDITKEHLKSASKRAAALGMLPQNKNASLEARKKEAAENISAAVSDKRNIKNELKNDSEVLAAQKKLQEVKKKGNKEEIDAAKKYLANVEAKKKEELGYTEEVSEANKQILKSTFDEIGAGIEQSVGKLASSALSAVEGSIDANLDAMYGAQGRMAGRLQGSAADWSDMVDNVSDTIGFSGMVSKKSVVAKMVELVDSGVAYNLEMRAFLAETSQNIASTFDATNGTLLRLIRLQQADTTAARLGMEASLTKLFNDYFQDTSYLADSVSDSVAKAILDASATMSRDDSLAFEYVVQKWLGSLYSLGMSDEAVSSIASGINYLATGNVSALSGNDSLANLLTLSASRSGGKSYSDLLLGQMTADDANKLLKGMIEYLSETASSQTNYVNKSAYADLFGMSLTDFNAFTSLTTEEINSLYNSSASYKSLTDETQRQLNEVSSRLNISTLIDNVIDNAMVGAAETIGGNAFTYGTWKALNILQENVGAIKIPSVLAAGFGLSSDIDLLNVAKTGMVGMGLIGSLLGAIGGMRNGGASNLAAWTFQETTERGGGLSLLTGPTASGKSYSALIGVGSASGEDAQAASLASAEETAYENSGVTSEEVKEGQDIPKDIYNALAGTESTSVISLLKQINDRVAPERVFYTAIAGVLTNHSVALAANLSASVASANSNISNSPQPQNSFQGNADEKPSIETKSLESVIQTAVQAAVEAVVSTITTANPLPVSNVSMYSM